MISAVMQVQYKEFKGSGKNVLPSSKMLMRADRCTVMQVITTLASPPGFAVPKANAAEQASAQQAATQAIKPMQTRPQPRRMQQVCNASASHLQTGMKVCLS